MADAPAETRPETGFLGRLGGMLLHPWRTLEGALSAPGRTATSVVLAACAVAFLAQPFATARSLAMIQISVVACLTGLVGVLARMVLWELIAITVAGWALVQLAARGQERPDPEGIHAAAALTLVPFLVLMLLGAALERLGVGDRGLPARLVALLPQVPWRALLHGPVPAGHFALKLFVAYAPTTILLAGLTIRLVGRRKKQA